MQAYRQLKKEDYYPLINFFAKNKDTEFFDAFLLNKESARIICEDEKNLYVVICSVEGIIGFGMLRWYKHFQIPTLGLLIDKKHRNAGLGKSMYKYLLGWAKLKKCPGVIAIVHKNNIASLKAANKVGMIELKQLCLEDYYDFTEYAKKYKDKIILIKRYEK